MRLTLSGCCIVLGMLACGVPASWAKHSEIVKSLVASPSARHVMLLQNDGAAWQCGFNRNNQLGTGTNTDCSAWVQLAEPTGICAAAVGGYHTLALMGNGTIKAWGYNGYGQLGIGNTDYSLTNASVTVSNISDATAVGAGNNYSTALLADGTVRVWGENYSGQLCRPTPYSTNRPTVIAGLAHVTNLSAGGSHILALLTDGTVRAWGENYYGQLGDGSTVPTTNRGPVAVSGLSGVIAIAAGYSHSLALKSDSTVQGWGNNSYGQLGNRNSAYGWRSPLPVPVLGLSNVVAIAAGDYHSLALKSDGTVWAWGANWWGQLGDHSQVYSDTPLQVGGLSGVSQIAAGNNCSFAMTRDHRIWSWGSSEYGQLGVGRLGYSLLPVQVPGLIGGTNMGARAAGNAHLLAVLPNDTVRAWGRNDYGQLGDGTTVATNRPVSVALLSNIDKVSAGRQFSMALGNDRRVWGWGDNYDGQIGPDVYATNRPMPIAQLANITAIAAGFYHSLVVSNGAVYAMGYNSYGQLGNGSYTSTNWPTPATGLAGITAVAAGSYHSLALKNDGTVWGWGDNSCGEVGNGTYDNDTNLPVQVIGLSGVAAIAAGNHFSVALKADGTVRLWGTYDYITNPAPVSGLSGITAIAAGNEHLLARKSDGTVYALGYNTYGALGDGTVNSSWSIPVQVAGLSGVAAIAAGNAFSVAVKTDGTIWIWGYDMYGQLGNGTWPFVTGPVVSRVPVTPIPPNDFDGDGRSDVAVYETTTGNWYIRYSSTGAIVAHNFGVAGVVPVQGDFDGDGRADPTIFRAADGAWGILYSGLGTAEIIGPLGGGFTAVPADYDGDQITDVAVYHGDTQAWYVRLSSTGAVVSRQWPGFWSNFTPIPADFDGDLCAEYAVYHAASYYWLARSTLADDEHTIYYFQYGADGCVPVAGQFDAGDYLADPGVYQSASGLWGYLAHASGSSVITPWPGVAGCVPVAGQYDNDGIADLAVFRAADGVFAVRYSLTGTTEVIGPLGAGFLPIR